MGIYTLGHANERMKYVSELFFQITLKLKASPIKISVGKKYIILKLIFKWRIKVKHC